MKWNWQQKNWPNFTYDKVLLNEYETKFLYNSGFLIGAYHSINEDEKNDLIIELISEEALNTSAIEGEYLNRDSVQSSIKHNFGLATDNRKVSLAEQGIAEMMVDLHLNYAEQLSHNTLFKWHEMLVNGRRDLVNVGRYRTHFEPMQVISGSLHQPKIHFEAPPSHTVNEEMEDFIQWFNNCGPQGSSPLPALIRASITHLYFVCIHPFEDGNGRIARALAEKALSQCINHPTLTSLSHCINSRKKLYYEKLESNNKNLEISDWIKYFAELILESIAYSKSKVELLIQKAKIFDKFKGKLNIRQEKVIIRIFQEGIEGFKGGLSADNYIKITKASRATATRDLYDLVEKNLFVRTGELKSTRYFLNVQKTL